MLHKLFLKTWHVWVCVFSCKSWFVSWSASRIKQRQLWFTIRLMKRCRRQLTLLPHILWTHSHNNIVLQQHCASYSVVFFVSNSSTCRWKCFEYVLPCKHQKCCSIYSRSIVGTVILCFPFCALNYVAFSDFAEEALKDSKEHKQESTTVVTVYSAAHVHSMKLLVHGNWQRTSVQSSLTTGPDTKNAFLLIVIVKDVLSVPLTLSPQVIGK